MLPKYLQELSHQSTHMACITSRYAPPAGVVTRHESLYLLTSTLPRRRIFEEMTARETRYISPLSDPSVVPGVVCDGGVRDGLKLFPIWGRQLHRPLLPPLGRFHRWLQSASHQCQHGQHDGQREEGRHTAPQQRRTTMGGRRGSDGRDGCRRLGRRGADGLG